jgi:hypothetical protein
LKTMVQQHVMRYTVVTSANQPANGISKCITSPTQYWREAERVQGTQPAVTALKKLAMHMAKGRRSQNKNRAPKEEELPSDDEEESMEVVKAVEEDEDGEEQDAETLANTVTNGARKGEYRAAYKAAVEQKERNRKENKRRKKRRIQLEEGISSDEESVKTSKKGRAKSVKTSKRGRAKAVKDGDDHDEGARSQAVSRQGWTREEHGAGHPIRAHDSTESAMEEADEASDGSEVKGSSVEESKSNRRTKKRNEQHKEAKKSKMAKKRSEK